VLPCALQVPKVTSLAAEKVTIKDATSTCTQQSKEEHETVQGAEQVTTKDATSTSEMQHKGKHEAVQGADDKDGDESQVHMLCRAGVAHCGVVGVLVSLSVRLCYL
jgi:hypothetical protein